MNREELLLDLKARQERGGRLGCPRCGKDRMSVNVHRNALSRYADIYVCDACGMDEALRDFLGDVLPPEAWDFMKNQ